jgi:hypothetical protein
MNLKNIKRYSRISKPILLKKVISRFNNKIINRLQALRDTNASTYSIDYLSYFKLASSNFNLFDALDINIDQDNLIEYCNSISNHKFKLLSNKEKDLNRELSFDQIQNKLHKGLIPTTTKCFNIIADNYNQIEWQTDFNNNYSWNYALSKNIVYGNNIGSDIKVPWELGRFQHLPNLAYLYTITHDNNLVSEIKNQIFDFMASNPPNYGVQWISAMDVGIRLVNLIFTLQIIQFRILFTEKEIELIESYLFDHYIFIKNNDEYSDGMRGNHYLSNICSIVIYLSFIEDRDTNISLLNKYINILNREIEHQFNSDGTNFESSTRYHIFTSQMILTVDIVLNYIFQDKYKITDIEKILSFTSKLLEYPFPPQFGDNDSGFYWKITNDESETYKHMKSYIESNYNVSKSNIYNDLGYIHKELLNLDLHFKCGKLGQNGKGGHDHNDNLSYCLYTNKIPLVVDPGTYCYTSDFSQRNKFRSNSYHNVVSIDDEEQNEYQENIIDDMFWLDTNRADTKLIVKQNRIVGSIYYCGKQLEREIEFDSSIINISDLYNSKIDKYLNIHLHPDVEVVNVENNVYKLCINEHEVELNIKNGISKVQEYEFSPEYGVKQLSKRIVIESYSEKIIHTYKEL